MDYEKFEIQLLNEIKNNDENCITTLEDNAKLVKLYLQNTEKPIHIQEFVKKLNEIILTTDKYFLIETVLKHDLCQEILKEFSESSIFIEACKMENISALKWLLTMPINYYIQDDHGKTALMYAAEKSKLLFVVEELIKGNDELIHITDENGENALFHAVHNEDNFVKLVDTSIDLNHQNNQMDTVLLYCCKNDLEKPIEALMKVSGCNYDITDEAGNTAAMYLAEHEKLELLINLLRKTFDINYRNKNTQETLVSIFLKKYHGIYSVSKKYSRDMISLYIKALISIIKYPDCDLNAPIDEFGNTPIMFFMMINDVPTVSYILSKYPNLDLSIKNKNGISASLLLPYINEEEYYVIKAITEHPTFDAKATDHHNNSILIHSILCDNYNAFSLLLIKNQKTLHQINDQGENALMIATKLGYANKLKDINLTDCNVNQQDHLGNTALYYALKIKDRYAINLLAFHKGDSHLKNNEDQSALDLLETMTEEEKEDILDILRDPVSSMEMSKQIKKEKENKGKSFLFMKKKKTTDEKVEEYVQNYQINNYRKVYQPLMEEIRTYPKATILPVILELEAYNYFVSLRENYIQLKCANPQNAMYVF